MLSLPAARFSYCSCISRILLKMSSYIVFIFISSFTNWSYFTDEELVSKINAPPCVCSGNLLPLDVSIYPFLGHIDRVTREMNVGYSINSNVSICSGSIVRYGNKVK